MNHVVISFVKECMNEYTLIAHQVKMTTQNQHSNRYEIHDFVPWKETITTSRNYISDYF